MVRRHATRAFTPVFDGLWRAVSNHGRTIGLSAILRDALASLGLLRMRSTLYHTP
jgi:hypothetical protein